MEAEMTDAKTCPKCNGAMIQGRIMKFNEYTAHGQYMYVFAADDEPGPDLSKMFSGKPLSKSRKALVAFSCESCGFVEFYGIASA
jgi:predicted nucleic-acid-binding Zn-ribbon protein